MYNIFIQLFLHSSSITTTAIIVKWRNYAFKINSRLQKHKSVIIEIKSRQWIYYEKQDVGVGLDYYFIIRSNFISFI